MCRKLFLDDSRFPLDIYPDADENEFDSVRSFDDFVEYIKGHGLPGFISFDNDLGFDAKRRKISKTGFEAAKWLAQESGLDLTNFKFKVHSSDPSAEGRISALFQ